MRVPVVGEGESEIEYRFGKRVDGPRAGSVCWAEGLPGAFFIFLFLLFLFFFCSLISAIDFAKILQFKSNIFQKFLKGVHIILSQ
jgi:hypothetical protein